MVKNIIRLITCCLCIALPSTFYGAQRAGGLILKGGPKFPQKPPSLPKPSPGTPPLPKPTPHPTTPTPRPAPGSKTPPVDLGGQPMGKPSGINVSSPIATATEMKGAFPIGSEGTSDINQYLKEQNIKQKEQKNIQQNALAHLLSTDHIGNNTVEALTLQNLHPTISRKSFTNDIQQAREQGLRLGFIHPSAEKTIKFIKSTAQLERPLEWKTISRMNKKLLECIELPNGVIVFLEPSQGLPLIINPDWYDWNPLWLKSPLNIITANVENTVLKTEQIVDEKGAQLLLDNLNKARDEAKAEAESMQVAEAVKREQQKIPHYRQLIDKIVELDPDPEKNDSAKYEKLLSEITKNPYAAAKEFLELEKGILYAQAGHYEELINKAEKLSAASPEDIEKYKTALSNIREDRMGKDDLAFQRFLELERKVGQAEVKAEQAKIEEQARLREKELADKQAQLEKEKLEEQARKVAEEAVAEQQRLAQELAEKKVIEEKLKQALQETQKLAQKQSSSEITLEPKQPRADDLSPKKERLADKDESASMQAENAIAEQRAAQEQAEKMLTELKAEKLKAEKELADQNAALERATQETAAKQELLDKATREVQEEEQQLEQLLAEQTNLEVRRQAELQKQLSAQQQVELELQQQKEKELQDIELEKQQAALAEKMAAEIKAQQEAEAAAAQQARLAQELAAAEEKARQAAQTVEKLNQALKETQKLAQKKQLSSPEIILEPKIPQADDLSPKRERLADKDESASMQAENAIAEQRAAQEQAEKMLTELKAEKLKTEKELADQNAALERSAQETAAKQELLDQATKEVQEEEQQLEQLLERQAALKAQQTELLKQVSAQKQVELGLQQKKEQELLDIELEKQQAALAEKMAAEITAKRAAEKAEADKETAEKAIVQVRLQQDELQVAAKQAHTNLELERKTLDELMRKQESAEIAEREKLNEQLKEAENAKRREREREKAKEELERNKPIEMPGGDAPRDDSEDKITVPPIEMPLPDILPPAPSPRPSIPLIKIPPLKPLAPRETIEPVQTVVPINIPAPVTPPVAQTPPQPVIPPLPIPAITPLPLQPQLPQQPAIVPVQPIITPPEVSVPKPPSQVEPSEQPTVTSKRPSARPARSSQRVIEQQENTFVRGTPIQPFDYKSSLPRIQVTPDKPSKPFIPVEHRATYTPPPMPTPPATVVPYISSTPETPASFQPMVEQPATVTTQVTLGPSKAQKPRTMDKTLLEQHKQAIRLILPQRKTKRRLGKKATDLLRQLKKAKVAAIEQNATKTMEKEEPIKQEPPKALWSRVTSFVTDTFDYIRQLFGF